MIRAWRRRHRWAIVALALLLPLLLAWALSARRPLPVPDPGLESRDNPVDDRVAPKVDG